jgi:hypothetical protein
MEAGRFSIAAGEYGLGRVVAFGSHPEFGFDLPMIRWGQPARMFANAVLWQAMSQARLSQPSTLTPNRISLPVSSALDDVGELATALVERIEALQAKPIEPAPAWLAPAYAMSVFGLPPDEIWRQTLADIVSLATEAASLAAEIAERVRTLTSGSFDPTVLQTLAQIDQWLLDERPAEWAQDGGYQGVHALLRTATRMCEQALANWDIELGPPDGPYGYVHDNPYHLVVGSYLAAIGNVGGAVQLLRGLLAVSRQHSAVSTKQAVFVEAIG